MQFRARGQKKKKKSDKRNPAGCVRFSFSSLLGLSARAEPDAAWAIGWSSWVDEKDDEDEASGRRSAVRSSSSRAITDMVSKPTDQTKKNTIRLFAGGVGEGQTGRHNTITHASCRKGGA